jgi:hypothetical protein
MNRGSRTAKASHRQPAQHPDSNNHNCTTSNPTRPTGACSKAAWQQQGVPPKQQARQQSSTPTTAPTHSGTGSSAGQGAAQTIAMPKRGQRAVQVSQGAGAKRKMQHPNASAGCRHIACPTAGLSNWSAPPRQAPGMSPTPSGSASTAGNCRAQGGAHPACGQPGLTPCLAAGWAATHHSLRACWAL